MKTILYEPAAAKDLRKLPPNVRDQLREKLRRYAESGLGDVRALTGRPGLRLRSGDYRIPFVEAPDSIGVVRIGHRRNIYA